MAKTKEASSEEPSSRAYDLSEEIEPGTCFIGVK
jgi:hypothetical protein